MMNLLYVLHLIYEPKIGDFKCMSDMSVCDCYLRFASYVIFINVNKHIFECLLYFPRKAESEQSRLRFKC